MPFTNLKLINNPSPNLEIFQLMLPLLNILHIGYIKGESRPWVFENWILRRIFGPKRDEIASGEGSTMRNLIVFTVHLNTVRMIKCRRLRWTGHVARMEEGRSTFKILTGKPTGKRPLGRHRWEDNIRMDVKEIGIDNKE